VVADRRERRRVGPPAGDRVDTPESRPTAGVGTREEHR
jgi:hypothetical protein